MPEVTIQEYQQQCEAEKPPVLLDCRNADEQQVRGSYPCGLRRYLHAANLPAQHRASWMPSDATALCSKGCHSGHFWAREQVSRMPNAISKVDFDKDDKMISGRPIVCYWYARDSTTTKLELRCNIVLADLGGAGRRCVDVTLSNSMFTCTLRCNTYSETSTSSEWALQYGRV